MSYTQIANVFHYLHRELPASANNKGVWKHGILTNANNKRIWEQIDGRYWNKTPFDISKGEYLELSKKMQSCIIKVLINGE